MAALKVFMVLLPILAGVFFAGYMVGVKHEGTAQKKRRAVDTVDALFRRRVRRMTMQEFFAAWILSGVCIVMPISFWLSKPIPTGWTATLLGVLAALGLGGVGTLTRHYIDSKLNSSPGEHPGRPYDEDDRPPVEGG